MESTKTAEKAQEICPRCTEPASKQCGGCKGIAYCSLECQQADWPSHKSMCKAFAAFAGPRPSVNMRRVVVFIPGEDKPRFKWAPLNEDDLRDGNGEHIHPSRVVETPEYVTWGSVKGVTNVWAGAPLGYNIQVWHDDDFMEKYQHDGVDGKALRAATQGMDAATWRGPVMACCGSVIQTLADLQAGHPPEDTLMLDMDLRAYSHLTGIMIDCYNETLLHAFHRVPGKVQCVEMACGQGNNSTEVHKLVQVPRTHPMFQGKSQLSEVSKQLQEHLITYEVPTKTSVRRFNPKIVSLHICCDPTLRKGSSDEDMPEFGWAPMRYNFDVGTHLVARGSGEPLTGETVDAMTSFCRFHLSPYFQKCMEDSHAEYVDEKSPSRSELRQKVMDQITRENWKTYLAQWKAEQIEKAAAESRGDRVYTIEKARAGLERMGVSEDDSDRVSDILFNMRDHGLEAYKHKYGGD